MRLTPYLLTCLLFSIASLCFASDLSLTKYTYKNINDWHGEIDEFSNAIGELAQDEVPTDEFLSAGIETLSEYRKQGQECAGYFEESIENIEDEFEIIGESPDQDTAVVAAARSDLASQQDKNNRKLKSCKLLLAKIDKAQKWLTSEIHSKEAHTRLYRAHTLLEIMRLSNGFDIFSGFSRISQISDLGAKAFTAYVWFFWVVGLLMLIPALVILHRNRAKLLSHTPENYITHQTFFYFFSSNRILLFLLAIVTYCWGFVAIWCVTTETSLPLLHFLYSLALSMLFLCITNAVFPGKNYANAFIDLPKKSVTALRKHTRFLIIFCSSLIIVSAWPKPVDGNQVSEDFIRLIFLSLFAFSLTKVIWHLIGFSVAKPLRPFKYLVPPVAIVMALALLTGYYNFIEFICQTISVSYFVVLGGYFIYRVLTDFFDSLDEGRYRWQRDFKETLELPKSEIVPGLIWLRIFVVILIYSGIGIFLINEWTASAITTEKLVTYIATGFEVGSIAIVPMQIFQALIFIAISMSVLLWTRKQFEMRVLSKSRMDVGARDALGSILMYSMGLLTILIAVSIAGVSLGNLAIIAGALSVGIGFGLQAIVNNFVSGLILLLERPIQKGDWIIVDDTEGYVKRISVRSTQIQTFDHADVIVPNSDLITHVVKNWTLKNYSGRICIPVGVAYDCDTEKVRDILLEIAQNRPEISMNPQVAPPRVLLLDFAESTVNMELRFFVNHINDSLSIASEVRFEILKRFKEEGIVIPFPQRVVHLPKDE